MEAPKQAKKIRPNPAKGILESLSARILPTSRDLGSDECVRALYHRWCLHYNICRTSEEMATRFDIFMKNAIHVFEMNKLYPSPFCEFHLSSACDEKDLFDPSGDEEMTLTPTVKDFGSDEAAWDLYNRWCLYHKILRTPEEMKQRFSNFKMSALRAVIMPQKDLSLSPFCDKIDLHFLSGGDKMTLTPTEEDMETPEDLRDLYRRWCLHFNIHRTPEEMRLAFSSFKKSATYVFEMSQRDPSALFCLSIWCDETDHFLNEVTLIPTERDIKSGNALLGLYHRYCLYYKRRRTPEEMKQRFGNFMKSVIHVFELNKTDPTCRFFLSSYCDEEDSLDRAARKVSILPTFRDLGSDEAVWDLYHRWCLQYNISRTSEEMAINFDIFMKNAIHVFEMNELDPDPVYPLHLSPSCDETDMFDSSGDEEVTLTPTKRDLESDEAVLDLYYRWCLYHKILRTPEEMQQRFNNFKMNAVYAVERNQKELSDLCDKLELCVSSGGDKMTLTPTEEDMETPEDLKDLYRRWCLHFNIHRTPEEMRLAFNSFKKSATYVFEMSQRDPTALFCLSIWCDETDHFLNEVTLIPTERDIKSGNALLDLYHRYCLYYKKRRTPEEMKQRFSNFMKSVIHVFELNKMDPTCRFFLSSYCDEEDSLDRAARKVSILPTFGDLRSDETGWDLYKRWCLHYNISRTSEEMDKNFNMFMKNAIHVFEMNELDPDPVYPLHLSPSCDEKNMFDSSGYEEVTLTPTKRDLESDEAVLDLYYRWCLYHKILRTHKEMQQRFNNFKMNAVYAVERNQKELSDLCDKLELCESSRVKETTLSPTKEDMESDEALMDLYRRWCCHHDIRRTNEEMQLACRSFEKCAIYAFEMSQKDPTFQFCLSIWCDETDRFDISVRVIPTERDLKSGNALLDLYHRYCLTYGKCKYWSPLKLHEKFYIFKKNVNVVFEKNKTDPSEPFLLTRSCERKLLDDRSACSVGLVPTFKDLGSDEAVWALYKKWCFRRNIHRTCQEMQQRLNTFKKKAEDVFRRNMERPGSCHLFMGCDGIPWFLPGVICDGDDED